MWSLALLCVFIVAIVANTMIQMAAAGSILPHPGVDNFTTYRSEVSPWKDDRPPIDGYGGQERGDTNGGVIMQHYGSDFITGDACPPKPCVGPIYDVTCSNETPAQMGIVALAAGNPVPQVQPYEPDRDEWFRPQQYKYLSGKIKYVSPLELTSGMSADVPLRQYYKWAPPRASAEARAIIESGHVIGVEMQLNGSGYPRVPTIVFQGGGGNSAQAYAELDKRGGVAQIVITQQGAGYYTPPKVAIVP